MAGIVFAIVLINIFSFMMFAARSHKWGGFDGKVDELSGILAIGGSFGAFLGMRIYRKGFEYDSVFKIVIPVSMVIQILTIGYLFLFDLGIVN